MSGAREPSGDTAVSSRATAAQKPGAKASPAAQLRPFDVLGNYQLLKRLGGGGMADVWLARATLGEGVDKLVAFKTVHPGYGPDTAFGAMFLNEAKVSATLSHPSLVQVFDFGEAAGRPYLGMEFIHGRDLSAVLQRLKGDLNPPPVDFAVAVVLELVKALEHVHQKKDLDGKPLALVHRDVSPANVQVTARSEVKLMDFGVVATAAARKEGLFLGKLPYMSPDHAMGNTPMPAWDLFGAAVVLYELLTLRRPFAVSIEPIEQAVIYREQRVAPSAENPDVPKSLDALVTKATQLDVARRYGSAVELRTALEAVQREVGACDVGARIKVMFGRQLADEEAEVEALMAQARRLAPRAGLLAFVLRPFRSVRRRIATTGLWIRLSRYPKVMRGLAVTLALALSGGGYAGYESFTREAAFVQQLKLAETQARAGRVVGSGGDQALDHLLAAKALKPGDWRILRRLDALADLLEELGASALARGSDAEASAHYQGALSADPSRAGSARKLQQLEQRLRESSRSRVVKGK